MNFKLYLFITNMFANVAINDAEYPCAANEKNKYSNKTITV